jgi:hypothetical protein
VSPIADWYTNQLATYGWGPVLAVQAAGVIAISLGLAAALDWNDDRHELRNSIRDLEKTINNPAVRAYHLDHTRKEKP